METSRRPQHGYMLVIERGRSRFPHRPIWGERFLIGAGSNCQLQLGGDVPILHSIILQQADGLWIDSVVLEPALLINGKRVREGELHRGDLIEIGTFQFLVETRSEALTEIVMDETPAASEHPLAELASQIEMLESVTAGQKSGMAALMESVYQSAADHAELESQPEGLRRLETAFGGIRELNLSQLEMIDRLQSELPAPTEPSSSENVKQSA